MVMVTTNAQRPQERRPRPNDQSEHNDKKGPGRPNKANIEMFKTKFITDQLALTSQEAEAFWPVYNEYKNGMRTIYKEKKENEIELQEAMLTVRKKLASALKPILKSDTRINDALKIDKEFLKKMKNEMTHRRGGPPPPPRRD
jgi:membrane-associated HD superfamily phosphohydrolase